MGAKVSVSKQYGSMPPPMDTQVACQVARRPVDGRIQKRSKKEKASPIRRGLRTGHWKL